MINVYDDFFTEEERDDIMRYCVDAPYYYGETDNDDTPPTGLVHNLWTVFHNPEKIPGERIPFGTTCDDRIDPKKFFDLFVNKIENEFEEFSKEYLSRFYINCFSPKDEPMWHTDAAPGKDSTTWIYFPDYRYDLEEGGETQFILDDEIYGIIPQPNRMISFPAQILHRATSLRTRYRFTVAIKYDFTQHR